MVELEKLGKQEGIERTENNVQGAKVEEHGNWGIMRTRSDKTLTQRLIQDFNLSWFITIDRVTPQVVIECQVSLV